MNTNLMITPKRVIELAFSGREMISADSIRESKIDVAQEYFLRPVLGELLFQGALCGGHATFVERFLHPALAHYVRYGIISELSVQISDSGAVVYQSEKADNMRNNTQESTSSSEQTVSKTESQDQQGSSNNDSKRTTTQKADAQETDNVSDKRSSEDSADKTTQKNSLQNDTNTTEKNEDNTDTSSLTRYDQVESTTGSKIGSLTGSDKLVANFSGTDSSLETLTSTVTADTITKKTALKQDETLLTELSKEQDTQTKITDLAQNTADAKQTAANDSQQSKLSKTLLRPATDHQRQVIVQRALFDANVLMAKAMRYVRANPLEFPDYEPHGGVGIGPGVGVGLGRIVF